MTAFENSMAGPEDRTGGRASNGEEELRFIRNFHDVFLSIGLGMFLVGLALASSLVGGNVLIGSFGEVLTGETRAAAWTAAIICFVDAAIVWGLAEVFARTRRLFLPAIVILIGFVLFMVSGAAWAYVANIGIGDIDNVTSASLQVRMLFLTLAVVATVSIFAYYVRMRLPFAMGLGGAALAATAVATLAIFAPGVIVGNFLSVQLLAGVFLFVLGVYFDARDPERRTRYSDNGFWLHFFAAPVIFGAVINMATGAGGFRIMPTLQGGASPVFAAVVTLLVVITFAIVSLLINRRALLVAGLLSAAAAIGILVNESGVGGAWTAATTLLVLGGAMVLLGGGWHSVRRVLVAPFPKEGLIARIVPPETGPNPRDQVVG
ncbi:MAG: hypothetical protein AAFY22_13885 [Pseudomonadota bacterium]